MIFFLCCGNPLFKRGQQLLGRLRFIGGAFFRYTHTRGECPQIAQFRARRLHLVPQCARIFLHEVKARFFLCRIAPEDSGRGRKEITMHVL